MRNTESGGKTDSTTSFSSRAVLRSLPERLLDDDAPPAVAVCWSASPERFSCSVTSGNAFGGIDR